MTDLLGVLEREKRSAEDLRNGEEALLNLFYFETDLSLFSDNLEAPFIICSTKVDF